MQELLHKLLKLSAAKKVGVTAGAIAMIVLCIYQFSYSETATRIDSARAHAAELEDERVSYRKRRGEYLGFTTELKQLEAEQRELLRALPKRAEIPTFLANIQEQAELAGLEVLSVEIGQEAPQDQYLKIPVKMEVRGGYHQIARFFRNVGELPRIVNIENLSMGPDRDNKVGVEDPQVAAMAPKLRAKFVAATFRFNDKSGGGGT